MFKRDSDSDPTGGLEQQDRDEEKPDADIKPGLNTTWKTRDPKGKQLGAACGDQRGREGLAWRCEVEDSYVPALDDDQHEAEEKLAQEIAPGVVEDVDGPQDAPRGPRVESR